MSNARFCSLLVVVCSSLSLTSSMSFPQKAHSPQVKPAESPIPQRSSREWVVLAADNEVAALTHDNSYFRYNTHVVDQKGDRFRDVVESKDGTVARTVMEGGRPLTADAQAAERTRLEDLAGSPSEFARHVKNDVSGKKLAAELIRMMPDAMIYTPVSDDKESRLPSGSRVVVFDFSPNPAWSPPTTTSEALTGLRGRVWIDAASGYVARLDGEIFRPVNIGWGMLAHVYPGGKVSLEQINIGGNRWIYSHFVEKARVRALMFKSIDISAEVSTSNYHQLPGPLSYQEAIKLLLR